MCFIESFVRVLMFTFLLLNFYVAEAQPVFQCTGEQGEPVFSSVPECDNARQLNLKSLETYSGMDVPSVMKKIRKMQRIDLEEIATQNRKGPASSKELGLGFGERMELKKLVIRKEGIERDITNRTSGSADQVRLKDELASLKKRIRQLRRRLVSFVCKREHLMKSASRILVKALPVL